jgi:FAD/FMN-containing dehydrogenase/Fe-S oxidoreductase
VSAPDPAFAARLRRELEGEVLDDAFSRARYSTDASFYRIVPQAVALPRSREDLRRAVGVARDAGVPVLVRGSGTSQCGQSVGEGLILDTTKHLRRLLEVDRGARTARVEPGLVLDRLNAELKPLGLFFPVDPATSSRATLGGMAGNNSAGARSIRYGMMVDNVRAIDALLSDGSAHRFGPAPAGEAAPRYRALLDHLGLLRRREADEIERRVPKLMRHVAGYNLHRVAEDGWNPAQLLIGSEGTLAVFEQLELELQPLPSRRVLGVCHFTSLREAMQAVPGLVELGPSAVELMDRTLLELARASPDFAASLRRFVRGEPEAVLLVEFSGDHAGALERDLDRLEERLGSLGQVLRAPEPALQREVWSVRKAGMNIVMSMKGDGKPVAFIEDCAVPLEHLAEYTERVSECFARHGTRGVWYAHASVGCLHVRPILNLKSELDMARVRSIAEETQELVRRFRGSYSGEHGDGLVRSEFIEPMLGSRLARAFEEIKDAFDPPGLLNPGKIVRPPRMDDPRLLRHRTDAPPLALETGLDWSEWGGLLGATEMCNNNGTCRKAEPGSMCPSYRVTLDEQHVTRGRANTLRDALLGRLGPRALASEEMKQTFDLCVSCKACRRECPTGVDVARMKLEFLHHYWRHHRLGLRERLVGWLPRYAPRVSRVARFANALPRLPGAPRLAERLLGLSARRSPPEWSRAPWRDPPAPPQATVALFVDTFSRWMEPENARASARVLEAAGERVEPLAAAAGERPLCCGRTFLSVGLLDEARAEARRLLAAAAPALERGLPIVGVEPSCLLTLRDELPVLLPGAGAERLARGAVLLEEHLAGAAGARLRPRLRPLPVTRALLHGHCHQKAFGALGAVEEALGLVPGLAVETIDASCCGMAGAFGYEAAHHDVSLAMAEAALLPAVRRAPADAWVVADGTSCRHQIRDGAGREAQHAARVLEAALGPAAQQAGVVRTSPER